MEISLGGYATADPDEPLVMVPPTPVEHFVFQGPVSKERLEDLQVWSCLEALGMRGALRHPVSIQPGNDPPDRILNVDGATYALELTELTMPDLRANLSRVRRIGRLVAESLKEPDAQYAHLEGRVVVVSDPNPDGALPADVDLRAVATAIAEALKFDKGYVGEGIDLKQIATEGWPQTYPNSNGFYGDVHGLQVQVYPADGAAGTSVPVVANVAARFSQSELIDVVTRRIIAKDKACNQLLILTTGLPDKTGHICPLDRWLFLELAKFEALDLSALNHLNGVLLHHWGTIDILPLFQRVDAAIPWHPNARCRPVPPRPVMPNIAPGCASCTRPASPAMQSAVPSGSPDRRCPPSPSGRHVARMTRFQQPDERAIANPFESGRSDAAMELPSVFHS